MLSVLRKEADFYTFWSMWLYVLLIICLMRVERSDSGLMILFFVGGIVFSGVGQREGSLWGRGGLWGTFWGWDSAGHLVSGIPLS